MFIILNNYLFLTLGYSLIDLPIQIKSDVTQGFLEFGMVSSKKKKLI